MSANTTRVIGGPILSTFWAADCLVRCLGRAEHHCSRLVGSVSAGRVQAGFLVFPAGSILVFVILIFVYVGLMNRLDRRHDVDDSKEDP